MHKMNTVPNYQVLKELYPDIKCILWDMDGTLMETERLHVNATVDILHSSCPESPLSALEIENLCVGVTDSGCLSKIQEQGSLTGLSAEEFIIQKTLLIEKYLKSMKKEEIFNNSVQELLTECSQNNIKQAVVTSSEKSVAFTLLDYLGLTEKFHFILTREDTTLNKPDPTPYRVAIEKMGLAPSECLIFEDSQTGLAAAKGSKAHIINANWYLL